MAGSSGENAVLRAAEVPREVLIAEIDRISASPGFVRSERLRRFRRHVAERYLESDLVSRMEYSIGLAVFDRGEGYDALRRCFDRARADANNLPNTPQWGNRARTSRTCGRSEPSGAAAAPHRPSHRSD